MGPSSRSTTFLGAGGCGYVLLNVTSRDGTEVRSGGFSEGRQRRGTLLKMRSEFGGP